MCKKHPLFYSGVRKEVNPAYDRNHRPGFHMLDSCSSKIYPFDKFHVDALFLFQNQLA